MFIFGLGYTAQRIAAALRSAGWQVDATGSAGNMDFGDFDRVRTALGHSTHILSSVPPEVVTGGDAALMTYGEAIAASPAMWRGVRTGSSAKSAAMSSDRSTTAWWSCVGT